MTRGVPLVVGKVRRIKPRRMNRVAEWLFDIFLLIPFARMSPTRAASVRDKALRLVIKVINESEPPEIATELIDAERKQFDTIWKEQGLRAAWMQVRRSHMTYRNQDLILQFLEHDQRDFPN